MVLDRVC